MAQANPLTEERPGAHSEFILNLRKTSRPPASSTKDGIQAFSEADVPVGTSAEEKLGDRFGGEAGGVGILRKLSYILLIAFVTLISSRQPPEPLRICLLADHATVVVDQQTCEARQVLASPIPRQTQHFSHNHDGETTRDRANAGDSDSACSGARAMVMPHPASFKSTTPFVALFYRKAFDIMRQ